MRTHVQTISLLSELSKIVVRKSRKSGKTLLKGNNDLEMYHQQQNKWYPQRFLLAHSEATIPISK